MKVLQKSQDSESHLSDKRWLYSSIAVSMNSVNRSFLLFVARVCNNIARFMVLTNKILENRIYKHITPKFIPTTKVAGFLSVGEM